MKKLFTLLFLCAMPLYAQEITVTIKSLVKQFPVDTNTRDTVLDLKKEIEEFQGIPTCQQRLLFNGHEMHDSQILEEEHVQDGSLVHLVLKLR